MRSAPQCLWIFGLFALILLRGNTMPTKGKSSGFSVVITALLCYTAAAFKLLGQFYPKKVGKFLA
jgi:hypothetical protein